MIPTALSRNGQARFFSFAASFLAKSLDILRPLCYT